MSAEFEAKGMRESEVTDLSIEIFRAEEIFVQNSPSRSSWDREVADEYR